MGGIDNFIASAVKEKIRKDLGSVSLKTIEKRLWKKYKITFDESINQFDKLDRVLREKFGDGADGVEKRFLENICSLQQSNNKKIRTIEIFDSNLIREVKRAMGDDDQDMILNLLINESLTKKQIIKKLKWSTTTGHRKINLLIDSGLIFADDIIKEENYPVAKYKTIFTEIVSDIKKNQVVLKLIVSEEIFDKSKILPIICGQV